MSDVALGAYPQQFPGCQMSCLPELWDCRMASSSLKKILNRHRSTATNIVSRLSYLGKGQSNDTPNPESLQGVQRDGLKWNLMDKNPLSWIYVSRIYVGTEQP